MSGSVRTVGREGRLFDGVGGTGAGASLAEPRRVLYVERPTFSSALQRATLEEEGFVVDWFPTAREALAAAATTRYAVWLLAKDDREASLEATALSAMAALLGEARVVLLGSQQLFEAPLRGYWQLPRPCPPRLLAQVVQAAAADGRDAA